MEFFALWISREKFSTTNNTGTRDSEISLKIFSEFDLLLSIGERSTIATKCESLIKNF